MVTSSYANQMESSQNVNQVPSIESQQPAQKYRIKQIGFMIWFNFGADYELSINKFNSILIKTYMKLK